MNSFEVYKHLDRLGVARRLHVRVTGDLVKIHNCKHSVVLPLDDALEKLEAIQEPTAPLVVIMQLRG